MLAIVIPYYKNRFFRDTLASLDSQTNRNFNVYIANDGSPEDPEPLITFYKETLNIRYTKFNENFGSKSLVSHWQRSVDMVQDEEWIMILGDDDKLGHQVVEHWHKNFPGASGFNVVRFKTVVIDESSFELGIFSNPEKEKAEDAFLRRLKGRTRSSLSEYIFRKSCYNMYGFKDFPLAWHSDDFAWLQFSNERGIYAINSASVYVRISPLSISGATHNLNLKKSAKAIFLKEVIEAELGRFSKKEANMILKEYEIAVKDYSKMHNKEWLFLFPFYLEHFSFIPFLKFIRRIFVNV